MSSIDLTRGAEIRAPRAIAYPLRSATAARALGALAVWLDIGFSAMALSRAVEAATPSHRAAVASTWVPWLERRLPR